MFHCLLFDLDGTLLDNRDAVIDGVAHVAQRFAPGRYSRADLLRRFGEPFDDFLVELVGGRHDPEEVWQSYLTYVRNHHERHVHLFPYVREGLEELRAAGYRLAVVTNKQREFAAAGLKQSGLAGCFEFMVTIDDVSRGKPSAEPVRKALEWLQVMPEEALMIGDSRYDVLAAVEAGVKSAVLEWYGPQTWADPVPDYRFRDLQSLTEQMLAIAVGGSGAGWQT